MRELKKFLTEAEALSFIDSHKDKDRLIIFNNLDGYHTVYHTGD